MVAVFLVRKLEFSRVLHEFRPNLTEYFPLGDKDKSIP